MQNQQQNLISIQGPTDFEPFESEAAIAVYTNGQPMPVVQVHLSGDILRQIGSPDFVLVESGHDSNREWIDIRSTNEEQLPNSRKITSNETATLPQYVRVPASSLEVVPITKTLTYCSGRVFSRGVRVYLPRGIRLANDNDKPVTDEAIIASLKTLLAETRKRGIKLEPAEDGGLQLVRMTVERL